MRISWLSSSQRRVQGTVYFTQSIHLVIKLIIVGKPDLKPVGASCIVRLLSTELILLRETVLLLRATILAGLSFYCDSGILASVTGKEKRGLGSFFSPSQ